MARYSQPNDRVPTIRRECFDVVKNPMRRIATIAVLAAALAALPVLSGCSDLLPSKPVEASAPTTTSVDPAAGGSSSHQVVSISDHGFNPATITVGVNARVVWNNTGKTVHNVSFDNGPTSGSIEPGGVVSHVFDKPGTYTYRDGIHPKLTGKVIVK